MGVILGILILVLSVISWLQQDDTLPIRFVRVSGAFQNLERSQLENRQGIVLLLVFWMPRPYPLFAWKHPIFSMTMTLSIALKQPGITAHVV